MGGSKRYGKPTDRPCVVGQLVLSVNWSTASGALAAGTDRAVIVYKP
jgi:hypothetical protein